MNEKPYESCLILDVTYGEKPLSLIFDKINGYIRKYDGTKYVGFFYSGKTFKRIFYRIRYLIMFKSNISNVYSHKYTKIKINSNDDLPYEKVTNEDNVVILIKSVFNENYNHYYYETCLEKFPYK